MANETTKLQTSERRQQISELINKVGKVRVDELSKRFSVSAVSIRADLTELEAQGLIKRIHGGAVRCMDHYYYGSLANSMTSAVKEKKLIAEKVADMVSDYDSLFFNGGTTGIYVLRAICEKHVGITVFTHSLFMAQEALNHSNVTTYFLGGKIDPVLPAATGERVISQISELYVEHAIISIGGIEAEMGLTTRFQNEALISCAMIEHSRHSIAVGASAKIGNISRARIVPLSDIDCLVTDKQALPNYVDSFRDAGLDVVLA